MTPNIPAKEPFEFHSCLSLTLLTGREARDLAELVEHLRAVPGAVIYHHTHHFLVQHQFLSPEPPNDFAYWVTNALLEEALGEELAAINLMRFSAIREVRNALVGVIERHLERATDLRTAPAGEEFHFKQSASFVVPTGLRAFDLPQFREAIAHVSISSISFHTFDARLHLERGDSDFARWLDTSVGEHKLADAIRNIDPYTFTLEGLRRRIIALIDQRTAE
jgi:Family of unknown function (DUF5752)